VPPVVADITPTVNLNVCSGKNATLVAEGMGTINWYASLSSTTALSTGSVFATAALNSSGTVTFYAEANTCMASDPRVGVTVTVMPLPVLSVNSSYSVICKGQSVNLNVSGGVTYTWSIGANSANITVSPTVTTVYTVSSTSSLGCVGTKTIQQMVIICTGIDEAGQATQATIYPNPFADQVQISFGSKAKREIRIYNSLGQLVWRNEGEDEQYNVDAAFISRGLYYLQVVQQQNVVHEQKVLKQ
jgi:hypothetical protein